MIVDDRLINPNKNLRFIMDKEKLTRIQVARLLGVSKSTIRHWLEDKDSKNYRNMRPLYIDLLEFRLKDKKND